MPYSEDTQNALYYQNPLVHNIFSDPPNCPELLDVTETNLLLPDHFQNFSPVLEPPAISPSQKTQDNQSIANNNVNVDHTTVDLDISESEALHEKLAKFFYALAFSTVCSEALSLSSLMLAKIGAPQFLTKVLHGASIGIAKNIVMSVSADDTKELFSHTAIAKQLYSTLPSSVAKFLTEEVALIGLNMFLNIVQDGKTIIKSHGIDKETGQKIGIATPEYPDRCFKTAFQRIFKDGSRSIASSLEAINDVIPNKAKDFFIDSLKGVVKDCIWSKQSIPLQALIVKNVLITAGKYCGEYIYNSYIKSDMEDFIDNNIGNDYYQNFLMKKFTSSFLPTIFLTAITKVQY